MTVVTLRDLPLIRRSDPDAFTAALWLRLRSEAHQAYAAAPRLSPLFLDSILNQPDFETALFHRIAAHLKNDIIPSSLILDGFLRASAADPTFGDAAKADISAVLERDPATTRLIEPFLYFKGYHAIQAHRLAHWLYANGELDFALYLQSRNSEVFQTDIHPAAWIGQGVLLDHATGLVVDETAVIEDEVSLLQNVTLGATGKDDGDRHPKLRRAAMIGAGAMIIGNIEVGEHALVAAGSVVLVDVPAWSTVAGVPARVVRVASPQQPPCDARDLQRELTYAAFGYVI